MSALPERPELTARGQLARRFDALRTAAIAPVDIASMVAFRIMLGLVLVWEVSRYFSKGWIASYWIEPGFNFSYPGFSWVQPLPGNGMYVLWAAMGVLALFIAIGLWYRISAALFALAFTYQFLLEQATYLNHFYLIILLVALLVVVPANRRWSVDAMVTRGLRSDTVRAWTLWLLRFQVGVVYFYAGLAKLSSPDWLAGEPMGTWLERQQDFPLVGQWLDIQWVALGAAWGGMLVDLLAVPLLLLRRTRVPALLALAVFHLLNSQLFNIGVFPVLALAAALLFCEPDWPRRLLRLPAAKLQKRAKRASGPSGVALALRRVGLAALGLFVGAQLLLPLRHHLYPGNVNWTEEGHQFAWHMMLRTRTGDAYFTITDPASNRSWGVDPRDHLASWQVSNMSTHPQMLVQFGHWLRDHWAEQGVPDAEVRVQSLVSLNGRAPARMIDPTVDLAAIDRCRAPDCILPLTVPLRR